MPILRNVQSLLERDAFLLIEGHLHEDRFRGGTGLPRRAWKIEDYCISHGQRLRLTLDTTVPGATDAFRRAGGFPRRIRPHDAAPADAHGRGIVDSGEGHCAARWNWSPRCARCPGYPTSA